MALELHERGFKNARPLAGGFGAWRDSGLPLTHDIIERRAVSND